MAVAEVARAKLEANFEGSLAEIDMVTTDSTDAMDMAESCQKACVVHPYLSSRDIPALLGRHCTDHSIFAEIFRLTQTTL